MNAPTREEFLARRRAGIGGSDISAILGLNQYKSQYSLWLDKTGRAPDEDRDAAAQERMYWGTTLEDVVAKHYATKLNVRVQRINEMLRHPSCEIAVANIDRAVVADGSRARWDPKAGRVAGAERLLEVKTAHAMAINGAQWGEPGTDEVPQSYWLQCQWYMGIAGLERADIAVLFGGQRFVVYTLAADPIFNDLLESARDWWQRHVVADIPPDPSTEDDARRMWRSHVAGRDLIVDLDVANDVRELVDVKQQIKDLEEREQALRDRILPSFHDAESISYLGARLATWKANKAGTKTDWKAAYLDARDALVSMNNVWRASFPEYEEPFRIDVLDARLRDIFTTTTPGARVLRLNAKE